MTPVRQAYLEAAESARALLGDPAVAAAWDAPSALPAFGVAGLAGHLGRQVLRVPPVLESDPPDQEPRSLLDHYDASRWTKVDINDEINVNIRRDGERDAADGSAALGARVGAAVDALRDLLPAQPLDRVVHLPWTGWTLGLDDFLTTRMLEIAVHSDDLAVSVGIATPVLPPQVLEPVLDLLSRLAVRRHGATAVLRAFSRAERAPATIAAI